MTDNMRERGAVVNSAAQMLSSGDVNLDTMPQLILRIIEEKMWEQRAIPQRRWELSRHFDSFEEFVTAEPLDGLHTSVQMLKDLCRRDVRAVDAIDEATRHRPSLHTAGNIVPSRPEGNSQAKALRRLRKDRPDLHAEVLDGKKTAHAAMVEAGLRHRTVSVRVTDPQTAARTLQDNMSAEDLAELVRILTSE